MKPSGWPGGMRPARRADSQSQGEARVSADPDLELGTILGSCVATCLYDAQARIGGMNHFLLPDGNTGDGAPARYGSYAMEVLINELLKRGASRKRLEAMGVPVHALTEFDGA